MAFQRLLYATVAAKFGGTSEHSRRCRAVIRFVRLGGRYIDVDPGPLDRSNSGAESVGNSPPE